ncbi:HNH endonuclease [uncultured Microbacterium sp.]|uniref:HNH endonuclease n=1 Tax=uncultured Microbacterium sp. TaxID=191216 RepID=UPI00345C2727
MAWSSSNRKQTLPYGWDATRRRILKRDGYRCTAIRFDTERRCEERATDVDHIRSHANGGGEEDSNLASLCAHHHATKSSSEGGHAAAARRRAAKKRHHPGLLP